MENPFASLVEAAEERVDAMLDVLDMENTLENRRVITNQLYEVVKSKDGGLGDGRSFQESMYLIALSHLQMRYNHESLLQHLND